MSSIEIWRTFDRLNDSLWLHGLLLELILLKDRQPDRERLPMICRRFSHDSICEHAAAIIGDGLFTNTTPHWCDVLYARPRRKRKRN